VYTGVSSEEQKTQFSKGVLMKTIKLTIIDTNAIVNSIDYTDTKVITAMSKDRDYSITLVKNAISKIKFGACKDGSKWFTVVNGVKVNDGGYQHSSNAIYFATQAAKNAGYNVK
jgi:hypothetical protein